MNCDRTGTVLHAYFDNELDALGAAEFEQHLETCPDCIRALESLESLRSSIQGAQLYEGAPASMRRKVVSAKVYPFPWRWMVLAAALFLCVSAGWFLASWTRVDPNSVLAAELVDAHLRSLQPGHLNDVVSSDQHTVKPWFAGKLDFSPPVHDFTQQGFPLEGGRLEVVHGRTSAALIYGRRKHLVSVFIWPASEANDAPGRGTVNGYHWLRWSKGGMQFDAVSDASPTELENLRRLLIQ